jgi:hypothetical protein
MNTPLEMTGDSSHKMTFGSRAQVMHGTALKTTGNLTEADLMMSRGRIVSIKKSESAKKNNNLGKFLQEEGSKTFGPNRTKKARKAKKSRKNKKHANKSRKQKK